jgi:hypothetical protein
MLELTLTGLDNALFVDSSLEIVKTKRNRDRVSEVAFS